MEVIKYENNAINLAEFNTKPDFIIKKEEDQFYLVLFELLYQSCKFADDYNRDSSDTLKQFTQNLIDFDHPAVFDTVMIQHKQEEYKK